MSLFSLIFLLAAHAASPALGPALGGSAPGEAAVRVQAGTWVGASMLYGLPGGTTLRVDYDAIPWGRHMPAVGLGRTWLDGRWRLSGEAMAGWLYQTGDRAQVGPTAEARIRTGRVGRVSPVALLGIQGVFPMSRTITIDVDGESSRLAVAPSLTLTGALGLAVVLRERMALEAGLDLDWVDVPGISIPGFYVALTVAGGTP